MPGTGYLEDMEVNSTAGKLADLGLRIDDAIHASGPQAVEKQHARGKMTARERVLALVDEGSFTEMDQFARHRTTAFGMDAKRPYGDGVIIGVGEIHGRQVCVFSQDVGVFGGSLGEVYGSKIAKIQDFAISTGCPLIGINEGGGARIQEGVSSLGAYGDIFLRNVQASGVIPQVSIIMGAAAGGHVYSPALTDFIVMVDQTSQMFITGPEVIKTVTGEDVSMEDLGGGRTHNTKSGNAHYLAVDESDALEYVRELITYLPQNNLEDAPIYEFAETADLDFTDRDRTLDQLVPDNPAHAYDMREVIRTVLDEDEFLEVMELYAPNVICGFGRVEGRSIGIVANQPNVLAGCLDTKASEKAARFVRTCDGFNIPVLTFVDVPGFLPGVEQEYDGIIRRGAKLIYAYAEATVPLMTVITRKAYGGAYIVMGSKHLGADVNLAWPTAQIAVMGAEGAVKILYRKELTGADDPAAKSDELVDRYNQTLANPYVAAERGFIDQVIYPHETRAQVIRFLRALRTKREAMPPKKHGNIPL
ncbi:acyl-CoA carboxylase subunit beta [Propionimicrobium sp. PCR01-08-3]|uniref:acyl-CoA carboxylase subunit beta n=1 Tax=Propionimicrobium sp. PCR01-08-3 TaxID=3052086 RepID=UPI00255C2D47|nr:acyl-CoA carboxylase subunit beta [Propionimicrobium sp. PCR01-08-3]WIY83307.1 acyl-CoA carboxylase subunit beta [Propionimicrobium sp. PCR01-08-3]